MSVSVIEICNSALTKMGERNIVSLSDDLPQAKLCKTRYTYVINLVSSLHPWTCNLKRQTLAQDSSYTKVYEFDYSYVIPNDSLSLWQVVDGDGDRVYDYEVEGRRLLANLTSIKILYGKTLLPDDIGDMDHEVAEVCAHYLAWDMSNRLGEQDAQGQKRRALRQDYLQALSWAKTNNSSKKAPRSNGPLNPFNRTFSEQPKTWIDSRN